MKRAALLIGNTGGLSGVKPDLENTHAFLTSPQGGNWVNAEIQTLIDPRRDDVLRRLQLIRAMRHDYVFVLFSGHGGMVRETEFNLNSLKEKLSESELNELAPRQLTIADCCRAYPEHLKKSALAADMQSYTFAEPQNTRRRFDNRIMQAVPQHTKLYSCSVGEYSIDDNGAVYLGNLLKEAMRFQGGTPEYKTAQYAHEVAKEATIKATAGLTRQTPTITMLKVEPEQQLIISLRP